MIGPEGSIIAALLIAAPAESEGSTAEIQVKLPGQDSNLEKQDQNLL